MPLSANLPEMPLKIRLARLADVPALERLIRISAQGIGREDYTATQIEAALAGAWGVDTQLIRDQTYFVAEMGGEIVGCGGWSRRKTSFGGDRHAQREPEVLNPALDAARIRAFFVHPDWARRGIGRALLQKCEQEARASGFQSVELVATLPGRRFYITQGYIGEEARDYPLENGLTITFVPMKKTLCDESSF